MRTLEFTVPAAYDGKKLLVFLRGGVQLSLRQLRKLKTDSAGILKNGVTGTIVGTGYAVLIYVTTVMNNIHHRLPWFYNAYITPVPQYLYHYWGFYGTERFGQRVLNPYTTDMMFLCVESLYLIAAAVAFGAYVCVKKRRI